MENNQPLTLEEIHQETLNILKRIIQICDELQINYYMGYGSLLGAARHSGFIPWDDDLDLTMLRPDYEKFVEYCREHAQDLMPYQLISRKNSPKYPFAIPRFCDTRYQMEFEKMSDAGMGMFIDIYPLDGLGDAFFADGGKLEQKLIAKKKRWLLAAELANYTKFIPSPHGFLRTCVKALYYGYAKVIGADYFLERLESLQNLYPLEQSSHVGLNVWDQGFYYTEKWHYEGFEYLDFEGMQVKVPRGYQEVLAGLYGDWHQLPPEEKRAPHHQYKLYRKA